MKNKLSISSNTLGIIAGVVIAIGVIVGIVCAFVFGTNVATPPTPKEYIYTYVRYIERSYQIAPYVAIQTEYEDTRTLYGWCLVREDLLDYHTKGDQITIVEKSKISQGLGARIGYDFIDWGWKDKNNQL